MRMTSTLILQSNILENISRNHCGTIMCIVVIIMKSTHAWVVQPYKQSFKDFFLWISFEGVRFKKQVLKDSLLKILEVKMPFCGCVYFLESCLMKSSRSTKVLPLFTLIIHRVIKGSAHLCMWKSEEGFTFAKIFSTCSSLGLRARARSIGPTSLCHQNTNLHYNMVNLYNNLKFSKWKFCQHTIYLYLGKHKSI